MNSHARNAGRIFQELKFGEPVFYLINFATDGVHTKREAYYSRANLQKSGN